MPTVTLAHGGGGKAMKDLIDDVFVAGLRQSRAGAAGGSGALRSRRSRAAGDRLAFTTDSFVVDPLFFPGGDIGKLAVCGTVNDLAVGGARPLYLSCAAIVEEGVTIDLLRRIAASMASAAADAGVEIVTGDTKVVQRGACDKLFLTTTGIGVIREACDLGAHRARDGDVVLVNGLLGDHGAAILCARGDMALESPIESDCAPLHGLIEALLAAAPGVRFMRDATRGGVATVLNEIAEASQVAIEIEEKATPIREEVKAFCEILGLDPLYLANEGKIVVIAAAATRPRRALAAMRAHPLGVDAAIVGRVHDGRGRARDDAHGVRRPTHRRHAGRRATAADLLRRRDARTRHHAQHRRDRRRSGEGTPRRPRDAGDRQAFRRDERGDRILLRHGRARERRWKARSLDIREIEGRARCACLRRRIRDRHAVSRPAPAARVG